MSDKRVAKPGIKTRKGSGFDLLSKYGSQRANAFDMGSFNAAPNINLAALERAFDDMAKRQRSVKRKGLRLLIRRLCYFVLSRT